MRLPVKTGEGFSSLLILLCEKASLIIFSIAGISQGRKAGFK